MNRAISAAAKVLAALALPILASAEDTPPMPRMLKDMGRGEWRMEVLEASYAKPGEAGPVMVMCTDNVLKVRHHHAELNQPSCTRQLLKDDADEAIVAMTCLESAVTTTLKREGATRVVADVTRTGKQPRTLKVRYTLIGECRPGERPGMRFERDSERCKEMRARVAESDPKQCAPQMRPQCEQMHERYIDITRSMCGV